MGQMASVMVWSNLIDALDEVIECDERAYGLALTKLQGAAGDEMLAAE